jgi:hypothetical protein
MDLRRDGEIREANLSRLTRSGDRGEGLAALERRPDQPVDQ